MKKLISLLISAIMLFQLSVQVFASYPEEHTCSYETGNCTVTYTVQNEWDSYRQIEMSVTNNGEETLRNWALKLDCSGEVADIWNAEVCTDDGEIIVLRNCGYNYEIIPGNTVEFGFQLRGEELKLPESVSLCNKTVDSTAGSEISYEITNNWDNGFIAEVSVTNNSDEPLEAWRLAFNGNFEITNLWNANKLYSENGFLVENDVTTIPIAKGETKKFGFQGSITPGETPEMSDFVLTSVVIDLNSEQPSNPDNPVDPDIPVDPDKPTDPDTPAEPDKPQEHIIMCFGEYAEEEKTLEVYWYSTDEGEISLYENTDNGGWTTLAENVEGESYKFEIEEDFLVKQIKAVQKTENGTLESEPFVVAHNEDGIVCKWLDSDSDGLADCVEEAYGTDTENPDTDGDGLTDYEEIFITGTNPLKYDTDENGINDAEDDTDGDGLSNKEEISLGTSVSSADTDEDDLSDYDELYKYNTDPLKADSDGDKLNDGEEIAIGLDPNNPETFGVPDAEYKVEQTISADSEVMSEVNTEESPYELSLEISATGNADTRLSASESTYSAVTDSDARLGGAVELRYLGGDVDKVKLTYKIADEYISNEGSEYAENCLDLQGIKRYNIFRYFDEINMLLPVATEFDEESNTLYAETDELGTYCVLDMEVLMRNFGIEPDELRDTKTFSRKMYSAVAYSENNGATDSSEDKYNIIFIIDDRESVITSEQYSAIKKQILEFAETIITEKRDFTISIYKQSAFDFGIHLVESPDVFDPRNYNYESSGNLSNSIGYLSSSDLDENDLFGENCVISVALNDALTICGRDTQNFIFDIYAQENTVYDIQAASSILQKAVDRNANISIISDKEVLTGFQKELAEKTNGLVLNYNESFASSIYEHIFNDEYAQKDIPEYKYGAEFDAILASGLQKVCLNSELYPNGTNPSGEDTDTDMDGLTDWNEVNLDCWVELGLITYDERHNVILPTIQQCMDFTEKSYVYEGLDRFKSDYYSGTPSCMPSSAVEDSLAAKLKSIQVMPISSDPTSSDGDCDGLLDSFENRKYFDPLNADMDGDGLSDGEEYRYGTNPRSIDSDYDGLNDKYEIENGINPLSRDTDGDGFFDDEDKNPNKYDVDWKGITTDLIIFGFKSSIDLLDGIIRGDFIREPNLAQLIGMILGSFIPGIDLRDVVGNLFYGDIGGALLSGVGLIPAAGDVTKLVAKVSDFIRAGAKNADEIGILFKVIKKIAPSLFDGLKKSDNISDILRHVPCKEAKHLFSDTPAITKLLDLPSNSGKYADEVVDAFKRVADRDSLGLFESFIKNNNFKDVADYEKRYTKIISNVSEFQDELMLVIKNADERTALKIAEFASDYGKGVIGAVDKCGYDNIYKITHYISESGVSGKVASELFEALSKHGDTLIKAVEKCGVKNIENIVDILSKINPNQVDDVLDLLVRHGDIMLKAVKKAGIENINNVLNFLIKLDAKQASNYLEFLSKQGDVLIKNLNSPKGLTGTKFEDYLVEIFGGTGSFKAGSREFDGRLGNKWWEAKSGNYWKLILESPQDMSKFKSLMPQRLQIAREQGATFELFSNTPIPESIKEWLIKKGIPFTELLF